MLKYIVIQPNVFEYMVLIHPLLSHADTAKGYGGNCIAAGFVKDGVCYGRSDSLDIESRGELDEELYKELMEFGKI